CGVLWVGGRWHASAPRGSAVRAARRHPAATRTLSGQPTSGDRCGGRPHHHALCPASSIIGQVKSGKVLALATAADKRSSALPEVPTMAEAGMSDFDTSLWLGLAGPAGLPRSIVDKLAGPAQKAMQAPDSAAALVKQGYDPHFLGPDQIAGLPASPKAPPSAAA